jgi:hypothetical protein
MKNTLHWDVTPFSAVGIYRRLRQNCCLTSSLILEAAISPQKAIDLYQTSVGQHKYTIVTERFAVRQVGVEQSVNTAMMGRSNPWKRQEIFSYNKPTRCTNFSNLFWKETLHVSDSSSFHHQEFFTAHTATVYVIQTAFDQADPARKLSTNLYDIYHCCVCSE